MKLAVDTHYADDTAKVAGILFKDWQDDNYVEKYVCQVSANKSYEPGNFYKRELPGIQALIKKIDIRPEIIIIDGYVFLDGIAKPGLGKHLYNWLDEKIPVIGVAKNPFKGIKYENEITRGKSCKPLFVTCAGIDLAEAKKNISSMHGRYRMPTLLKLVDQLSRKI
jgi:deoxyribonuclease V